MHLSAVPSQPRLVHAIMHSIVQHHSQIALITGTCIAALHCWHREFALLCYTISIGW